MPIRSFALEMKAVADSGEFEGFAATYASVPDAVGDIIEPGSFTKTLSAMPERPLLWQHKQDIPIGRVALSDSSRGLIAKGRISLGTQMGRDAYALLKDGIIRTLSIGFETIKSDYVGAVRHLKELRLWEVSLATLAANPEAAIYSVKSIDQDRLRLAIKDFRNGVLGALERN